MNEVLTGFLLLLAGGYIGFIYGGVAERGKSNKQ